MDTGPWRTNGRRPRSQMERRKSRFTFESWARIIAEHRQRIGRNNSRPIVMTCTYNLICTHIHRRHRKWGIYGSKPNNAHTVAAAAGVSIKLAINRSRSSGRLAAVRPSHNASFTATEIVRKVLKLETSQSTVCSKQYALSNVNGSESFSSTSNGACCFCANALQTQCATSMRSAPNSYPHICRGARLRRKNKSRSELDRAHSTHTFI